MKKITDFIVKGRYVFLLLFIILAGVSLYLSTKVNINDDIMKYLPKTSETKRGKDIMDEEFTKQDTSVLNVMFKGLSSSEKEDTLKKLQNIDGVSSVDYENTEEYNKDNYTLYILNVNDYDDSKTATNVYNYVNDNFKTAGLSGSIYDENKPILQLWIVILAIAFAMIILIILSDSYLEPWLYLISIGIAVLINKGTNIMFANVSSITNSIVAILQLALSMDYSIMLSNRYKQEKLTHKNKIDAMKEALYQSFKAISSSSVTTIVGLVALVFMSFSIGKDLGFVLAKGVLLSLISIFFCLPALLLIFDNWIAKTKKKSPKFNLTKLGSFIYKTRYLQTVLILVLFVGAYLLKGNIGILYTDSEQDKVGKVFPANNQIAIVYNNKYEELITNYCQKLEDDKNIDQVLCYSNTINEKLAYDELNKKFEDLGQDTEIEEDLIKLIYYNYYNKDANNKMTLNEFISFIKKDIYANSDFSNYLDQNTKNNIDLLENFTSTSLINKKRSIKELANILGINENDAQNILIYYNSKNVETKITIKDFVNFMLKDVANDKNYASNLDQATMAKLKMLQKFSDVNNINKKMNARELANIFGLDQNLIEQLFLFYTTTITSNTKMTLNEFATTALNMASKENYQSYFKEETLKSLQTIVSLNTYYDSELTNTKLYEMFGIDDATGMKLNYAFTQNSTGTYNMTPYQFVNTLLQTNDIASKLSDRQKTSLVTAQDIMNNISTVYSAEELAKVLNQDETIVKLVYSIYDSNKETMTPLELVNLILTNKDHELLKNKISPSEVSELTLVKEVMTSTLNNTKYTVSSLSSILNIDNNTMSLLFGLYNYKYINANQKISLYNYVKFIINDVMNNKDYSAKFDNSKKEKLITINNIMNSSLNSKKYTATEAFASLNTLSNNLDQSLVDLVYMYYGSNKEYDDSWKMTIEEFINYLNSDILTDSRFANFISSEKRTTITDSKKTVDKSKDLIVSDKYSRVVLNTKYAAENEDTYKFINAIHNKIGNNDDIYIVGSSPMAVEMSKTFNGELNKITILTMIFIFIVVAITFKDLIIPFVLILIIQTAVYLTMSAISITGGSVYFISLLIVQAILMGATIDYAIVYTSYYRESRLTMGIKDSVINAYNKSIHTIISSSSILIIVTLVVAGFASAIAAKICETISQGTFASVILILFILPGVLAATDKIICRKGYYKENKK